MWTGTHRLQGAYVEFTITNSSALYLSLHDARQAQLLDNRGGIEQVDDSVNEGHASAAPSVPSLVVLVDDQGPVHFDGTGRGVLKVASALDLAGVHKIRVTLLNVASDTEWSVLGFEGVWVSKGGVLRSNQQNSGRSTMASVQQPRHIEILSTLRFAHVADATSAYPVLVASALNLSHSAIPVTKHCLTDVCQGINPSVQDIYFRSGRPWGSFQSTRQSASPVPAALILSLGLSDFQYFLATDGSRQEVDRFIDSFVQDYVTFVTTIRTASQHVEQGTGQMGESSLERDASYRYNSAPSTMPIFLLTPFTPSPRLRHLLGHATSAVARHVNTEGDLSTVWIDSEGWLSKHDFQDEVGEDLSFLGHARVAANLAAHLCPYLQQHCPFPKRETVSGHVYIPAEAGMGKLLEDRKVTLIKEMLSMS